MKQNALLFTEFYLLLYKNSIDLPLSRACSGGHHVTSRYQPAYEDNCGCFPWVHFLSSSPAAVLLHKAV